MNTYLRSRELTGTVAELAGLLAGKTVDTSKRGYAEYLTRKYSQPPASPR